MTLGPGIRGSFRTFSVLAVSIVELTQTEVIAAAVLSIVLSIGLGKLTAWAGLTLGARLNLRQPPVISEVDEWPPRAVLRRRGRSPRRRAASTHLGGHGGRGRVRVGVLVVNVVGSFIAGVALGAPLDPTVYLIIVSDPCGGLTTFSTLAFKTTQLVIAGKPPGRPTERRLQPRRRLRRGAHRTRHRHHVRHHPRLIGHPCTTSRANRSSLPGDRTNFVRRVAGAVITRTNLATDDSSDLG